MTEEITNDFVVRTLCGDMSVAQLIAEMPAISLEPTVWGKSVNLLILPEGEDFNKTTFNACVVSIDSHEIGYSWSIQDDVCEAGAAKTQEQALRDALGVWWKEMSSRLHFKNVQ